MDSKETKKKQKKEKFKFKRRIWCPARSCRFNKTMRCEADSIKLKMFTDGRFQCTTYQKRNEKARQLDFLSKELQDAYYDKPETTQQSLPH